VFKKASIPIFFIYFLDNFGSSIVIPFFAPLFLGDTFFPVHYSTEIRNILLGFGIAMFPLAQFLGAPFFGDVADVYCRKKGLYYTVSGTIVGYILSAIAIMMQSIPFLFFSRAVTGFFAGNVSICFAALSDLFPNEKERAKNFGYVSLVGGVSWILGIILGGVFSDKSLSTHFDPTIPFWISAVLTLIGIPVLLFYFNETFAPKEKIRFSLFKGFVHIAHAFRLKNLRMMYLIFLCWISSAFLGLDWYPPVGFQLYKMSQLEMTLWLSLFGVTWMLGSSVVNQQLLKRYHISVVIRIGLIMGSVLLFLTAIPHRYYLFTIGYAFFNLFAAFTWPNLINVISMKAESKDQGTVMGITSSMQALGWLTVPIVGGFIAAHHICWLFFTAGVISLLPLILFRKKMTMDKNGHL